MWYGGLWVRELGTCPYDQGRLWNPFVDSKSFCVWWIWVESTDNKKLILSDFIHCQWFQLPPSTDDTQILDLAWISKALAPSLDNYLPCLEDTATQSLNGFRSQQVTSVLVALCYWQHLYLYLWSDYGLCRESPLCSCSSCFYSDDARNASGWVLGASRDMSKARMTSPGVTCGRQRWAWEKRENELKPSRS